MTRTVFMGTPDFAVPTLRALEEAPGIEVVGVFTRPDSVSRRGGAAVPSPVAEHASEAGLPVFKPAGFSDPDAVGRLRDLSPDVVVVASYGVILPREVLDIPPLGCLNVHASLLPRWRGAAPIERAILSADPEMGVSIMKMSEGLDTGPWCLQASIDPDGMGRDEIVARLAELGAECMVRTLGLVVSGDAEWIEQDDAAATYAPKISKAELALSPDLTAAENVARVRASSSHAAARASVCGRKAAVTLAALPEGLDGARGLVDVVVPGQAALVSKRLLLGAADGPFEVIRIKPDGKREMDAAGFAAGVHGLLASGDAGWEAVS